MHQRLRLLPILVVCAISSMASLSRADTIVARLDFMNPTDSNVLGSVRFDGNADFGTYFLGRLNWVHVGGDRPFGPDYTTFCIELERDLDISTHTFQTTGLASWLNRYGNGAAKASLISELWGEHYNEIGTDENKGAAFQLALWEITYDAGIANNQFLDNGRFALNYNPSAAPSFVTIAHQWLGGLDGQGAKAELTILDSLTTQDQIAAIPVPGAAWSGLAMLAGVILHRARRSRLLAAD